MLTGLPELALICRLEEKIGFVKSSQRKKKSPTYEVGLWVRSGTPEWCEDLKRRQDGAPKRAQSRGTEDSRTRGTAIEGVDLQAAMQSARAVMQASASPGAIQASSKEIRWISGHQRRSEGTEVRKCLPMGGTLRHEQCPHKAVASLAGRLHRRARKQLPQYRGIECGNPEFADEKKPLKKNSVAFRGTSKSNSFMLVIIMWLGVSGSKPKAANSYKTAYQTEN